MREFLGRSKIFIIICLAGLACLIGGMVYKNNQNQEGYDILRDLKAEVSEMENKLELAKGAKTTEERSVIYETGGIDPNRKAKDDGIMTEYMKDMFTWSNKEEYTAMYNRFVERLGKDHYLFTSGFLPAEYKDTGPDRNINSNFMSMVSYPLSAKDEVYEYMSLIRAESSLAEGYSDDMQFVAFYKIDKDGVISDFRIENVYDDNTATGWFK